MVYCTAKVRGVGRVKNVLNFPVLMEGIISSCEKNPDITQGSGFADIVDGMWDV
jgi:hypothetical protein